MCTTMMFDRVRTPAAQVVQYIPCMPSAGAERFRLRAQEVMRLFVQECGARMHWGKAGWPTQFPCFDVSFTLCLLLLGGIQPLHACRHC